MRDGANVTLINPVPPMSAFERITDSKSDIAHVRFYERTLRFICPSFPLRLSLAMRARIFPISLRSSWRSDPGDRQRHVAKFDGAVMFGHRCWLLPVLGFRCRRARILLPSFSTTITAPVSSTAKCLPSTITALPLTTRAAPRSV
jgi:hypothetical protein